MTPWACRFFRVSSASLGLALGAGACPAVEPGSAPLQELLEQNRRLQEQVRAQQQTIEVLQTRMGEVLTASERHERELRGLRERVEAPVAAGPARAGGREREVRVTGEVGLAFFHTGSEGQFPKAEFRADDPTIALEAPVWRNAYFFAELKLLPRETNADAFQLGELYVDFEDVSTLWGQPGVLGFRAGRINVPFGEEYLQRGPVGNPLISHSLSDIWGTDEGAEIYGRLGPVQYVLAVQNGGVSRLRDFNADKAVTGRLSWEPVPWLRLSASALRTGELAAVADNLSEVWYGNGFFRSIAPAGRAGRFWASLHQADATFRWKGGHLGLALGGARYDDSDPLADNARRLRHGAGEFVQEISGGLYGAVRYSVIRAPRGYPLAGWGQMGAFFFRPVFTEELERTSVGLGYRFGPPLVLKVEYARETGRTITGVARNREDFLGGELGMKF